MADPSDLIIAAPFLLEWLRDGNWPIAGEVADLLADMGPPVSPYVVDVLRGPDDIWKYWVLTMLAPRLAASARKLIMDECFRVAHHPTVGEKAEEIHLAAMDVIILDRINQ